MPSVKTEVPAAGGLMGMVQRCVAYECKDGEESVFEEVMADTAGSLGRDLKGLMCSCASVTSPRQFASTTIFDSMASMKQHTVATRGMFSARVEPLVARTLFEKAEHVCDAYF